MTPEVFLSRLNYDPDTGIFTWKNGRRAGTAMNRGYRRIAFNRKLYLEHRLAWFLTHGKWPIYSIDHINCDRTDNRINNLREATRAEQGYNKPSSNPTGFKGVRRHGNKFRADIKLAKKTYLGLFDTPEEAHAAYCEAATRHFGPFANFLSEITVPSIGLTKASISP